MRKEAAIIGIFENLFQGANTRRDIFMRHFEESSNEINVAQISHTVRYGFCDVSWKIASYHVRTLISVRELYL